MAIVVARFVHCPFHEMYDRPDLVYVLDHEHVQVDHDILGIDEKMLSVRLWNDGQSPEQTWILTHMDAKRFEPER